MIDGIRVVDAHQHFWDLGSEGYSWLVPEYGVIYDSFGVADAEPLAAAAGVDDVVLVQADDTIADTDAMLAIADDWPRVAGVVAWAPLTDQNALAQTLERYASDSRVVGIRHLMHEEQDPDWIVGSDVQRGLAALDRAGLSYDVVAVLPRHLEHVPTIAEALPELKLVIDHLAKPPIGAGDQQPWADLMATAAKYPNVSAKISGLDTTIGPDYTAEAIQPYVEHALEHFGTDRLMFGSDWPVNLLAGGYAQWWSTVQELLAPLSHDERAAVLGGTARAVYRLGAGA